MQARRGIALGFLAALAACTPDFRSDDGKSPIALSATAAARAMREDHYYLDHGTTPVLLTGVVRFVALDDGVQTLAFDTDDLAQTLCRFSQPIGVDVRGRITVLAYDPARSGDSIVYRRCRLA